MSKLTTSTGGNRKRIKGIILDDDDDDDDELSVVSALYSSADVSDAVNCTRFT